MTASSNVPTAAKPTIRPKHHFARPHRLGHHRVQGAVLDVGRQAQRAEKQDQQQHQVAVVVNTEPRYSRAGSTLPGSRNQPAKSRIRMKTAKTTTTRRRIDS